MFVHRFKTKAIPALAETSTDSNIIVYRMGEHVDICAGPLISNMSQFFKFSIVAVRDVYIGSFTFLVCIAFIISTNFRNRLKKNYAHERGDKVI